MGNYTEQLNNAMIVKSGYKRELYQSYMTGPEWRNVEMVKEYGAFIEEKKSMFQFPYFRQIAELWRVFYLSYASARKHNTRSEIFFSEYMLMDLFVVFFTTMELIPKGLLALFLGLFLKKTNDTMMQQHLAEFYNQYANALETIPFYEHDYSKLREELAEKYAACTDRTWGDWFSWSYVSLELRAKKWLSIPLRYMLHQEPEEAVGTTDILVKFNDTEKDTTPEDAKAHFERKIAVIKNNHLVEIIDEINTKEMKEGKTHQSTYARLRVPRYRAFLPLVHELADNDIHVRKIAGQDLVQVKCTIKAKSESDVESALQAHEAKLCENKTLTPLYSYTDRIHSNYKVCLFEVPVKNLHETLSALNHDGVEVESHADFIHNF
jgi:molybdenum cofactor biosynthesis enzyme